MNNNLISIIVPVYNQEKYLEKCLDSILEQSYDAFECILVDDGSSDQSPSICDAYENKDPRIKVIHKLNGGLTSARKAGFDKAICEYVCFLDSDDYLHKDFLKITMEKILKEGADVCTCGHFQDYEGTIIEHTFTYPVPEILEDRIISDYLLPIIGKIYTIGYLNYPGYVWGRIYRKSCISEDCFVSERDVYTEDDLFQMYLSPNLKKAIFIPDKLIYYRVNSFSLTHSYRKNMWKMLKSRQQHICSFFEKIQPQPEQLNYRLLASAFYAIYVSLRNAYELNSFADFKKDIEQILNDKLAHKTLKELPQKIMSPRQKLMVILLRLKWYRGLYYFQKLLFK